MRTSNNPRIRGTSLTLRFLKELNETSREPHTLPKALDQMLDYGEGTDKESEDDRLVEGGINQGLLLEAAAEADHISDHDDFCKDQRFDHGHPIIRVGDIIGSQKESSILRKSREHEGEIADNDPVLGHLMADFFLQSHFFLIRAAHNLWLSHETSLPLLR